MKENSFVKNINGYKNTILLALIGAVLFFGISMLFMRKYESDVEMLVIQKQSNWKIDDAYSAAKSAENISTLLVHVVGTTSFLDRVMGSGYAVDQSILNYNLEDRKEIWNDMVKAKVIRNSGIIELSIFNKNREKADRLANAVAYVLKNKADQYHGGGDRVKVKTIDGPITSANPVSPFMGIDALLGAVIGLFAGLVMDRKKNIKELDDRFNFAGKLDFEPRNFAQPQEETSSSAEPPMNLPFG